MTDERADHWTKDEHVSLVKLTTIEPDLSQIVDDRRQRAKMWNWIQRGTHALAEFVKWAAVFGGAVVGAKALLAGWLR